MQLSITLLLTDLHRFSCLINPVELCDDGEWKVILSVSNHIHIVFSHILSLSLHLSHDDDKDVQVTVDNSHGQAASECTLTLRGDKSTSSWLYMLSTSTWVNRGW